MRIVFAKRWPNAVKISRRNNKKLLALSTNSVDMNENVHTPLSHFINNYYEHYEQWSKFLLDSAPVHETYAKRRFFGFRSKDADLISNEFNEKLFNSDSFDCNLAKMNSPFVLIVKNTSNSARGKAVLELEQNAKTNFTLLGHLVLLSIFSTSTRDEFSKFSLENLGGFYNLTWPFLSIYAQQLNSVFFWEIVSKSSWEFLSAPLSSNTNQHNCLNNLWADGLQNKNTRDVIDINYCASKHLFNFNSSEDSGLIVGQNIHLNSSLFSSSNLTNNADGSMINNLLYNNTDTARRISWTTARFALLYPHAAIALSNKSNNNKFNRNEFDLTAPVSNVDTASCDDTIVSKLPSSSSVDLSYPSVSQTTDVLNSYTLSENFRKFFERLAFLYEPTNMSLITNEADGVLCLSKMFKNDFHKYWSHFSIIDFANSDLYCFDTIQESVWNSSKFLEFFKGWVDLLASIKIRPLGQIQQKLRHVASNSISAINGENQKNLNVDISNVNKMLMNAMNVDDSTEIEIANSIFKFLSVLFSPFALHPSFYLESEDLNNHAVTSINGASTNGKNANKLGNANDCLQLLEAQTSSLVFWHFYQSHVRFNNLLPDQQQYNNIHNVVIKQQAAWYNVLIRRVYTDWKSLIAAEDNKDPVDKSSNNRIIGAPATSTPKKRNSNSIRIKNSRLDSIFSITSIFLPYAVSYYIKNIPDEFCSEYKDDVSIKFRKKNSVISSTVKTVGDFFTQFQNVGKIFSVVDNGNKNSKTKFVISQRRMPPFLSLSNLKYWNVLLFNASFEELLLYNNNVSSVLSVANATTNDHYHHHSTSGASNQNLLRFVEHDQLNSLVKTQLLSNSFSNIWTNLSPSIPINRILLDGRKKQQVVDLDRIHALPVFTSKFVRFIEYITNRKVFISVSRQAVSTLSSIELSHLALWSRLFYSYQRLFPKLHINEMMQVFWLGLKFSDAEFISNWLVINMLKMPSWDHRIFFALVKQMLSLLIEKQSFYTVAKGAKIVLRGKISVAGNARTRTIITRFGTTSNSTISNRASYAFRTVGTFTGVLGLHVWVFY